MRHFLWVTGTICGLALLSARVFRLHRLSRKKKRPLPMATVHPRLEKRQSQRGKSKKP